jgi:hypothetical protein
MRRIGRNGGDVTRQDQAPSPRRARPTFVGVTPVYNRRDAVERALKEALVGFIADRFRYFAFGVGDHAVSGNDDVAFDAAHNAGILEDREVTQQRYYADNNDDHTHDLFGAAVDRQHVHEIKNQDDDDEGDQDADENGHELPRDEIRPAFARKSTPIGGFRSGPLAVMTLAD